MTTQKRKDTKRIWVRALCIFLAVLMIGSSLVAALSLLLVVIPKKLRHIYLWIPAMITFLVSCTAFFTDIAFGFDADYGFYRGPLGYVAFVVPFLYLVLTLWFAFRHFSERKGIEKLIPPICVIFCLVTAVTDALHGGVRLNEAIMIGSVFFYIFLYSHDTRRDQLTGLLNRQSFYDDCALLDKSIGAVASLDLNGLKELNDTRGHYAGDVVLQKLGESLVARMDRSTAAYRIGGDEFVILFFRTDVAQIPRLLGQIMEASEQNGCTLSVGYAIRAEHGDLEETIRESDRRMYENKAEYYRTNGLDRHYRDQTVRDSDA